MTLEVALVSAVGALSAVIGVLWRTLASERASADKDRRDASQLIFALLKARADLAGEACPPTSSTPDKPQFAEATALATHALNGDTERLVREYLATERPAPQ